MKVSGDDHDSPKCTPDHVADVLAALGVLMCDLHKQDLALQNAVAELATVAPREATKVSHIQHLDLITQTHEDLSRFLPRLAEALSETDFDPQRLAKVLRLQSLRDQLLKPDSIVNEPPVSSGDLSLF